VTEQIPRPPAEPVELVAVDRTHRAVLQNLGQLYRHDLSEPYRLLPNADGTFNNRRLDRFLTGADTSIDDFFVVCALRRTGVGMNAARQVVAMFPGRWSTGFQSYNPGVQRFWTQVAENLVGDAWEMHNDPPVAGRPPDSWITFRTKAEE